MEILRGEKLVRVPEKDDQTNTGGDEPMKKTESTFILPASRKNIETLWEWLNDENVGTIGIQGEPLMGKTWTVRQLLNRAVAASLFDVCLCIHGASNNYQIQTQILDQLDLKFGDSTTRVRYWVDTHGKEELMRKKISESLEEKRFLLILDDISSYDLSTIGIPRPRKQHRSSKVIQTMGTKSAIAPDRIMKLKKLSKDEAWLLLKEMSGCDLLSYDSPDVHELAQPLLDNCKGVPFDIVILAGTLRSLLPELSSSSSTYVEWQQLANMRKTYDLVLNSSKAPRLQFICEMLPTKEVKECFMFCCLHPLYHQFRVKELITCWMNSGFLDGFDSMEKAYDYGNMIVENLTRRHLFFRKDDYSMSVQTQLIKEAREYILTGFDIQLLERLSLAGGSTTNSKGELPIILHNGNLCLSYPATGDRQESPFSMLLYGDKATLPCVIPDVYFEQMLNLRHVTLLHCGISSLPVSISYLNHLTILVIRGCGSLENVDQIRGLQYLRVLSLSGARSLKEIPSNFFRHMGDLENLDLSNTQLKQLPSSFSNLYNIRYLILGGCSQLETVPSLESFNQLCLLDLSGASKLRKVPESSKSLQMLDLSQTLVDRLPSTSNLNGIQYLILKGCSSIETLPHPYAFPQLKVLDLSGSQAFKEFHGEISGSKHPLLKLDLSNTQIVQLPSLSKCSGPLEVLLRNCFKLETLLSLDKGIKVLDLSGAISIKQYEAASFVIGLLELDLSKTQIQNLPTLSSKRANLVRLFIRECEFLEELPHLSFPSLQILDLSGSVNFKKFEDRSFEKLCCLQTLDLSETKVAELPNLSACSHLRRIILRRCLNLLTLPELKTLAKLEVLDLSGATSFKHFQDDCLGRKEHFQELILSGTQTVQISIFSGCHNISKLILKDCTNLEMLPPLELFTKLKVLDLSGATTFTTFQDKSFGNKYGLQIIDLSGTQVKDLPSLSGCINLRQLVLRDCSNVETLVLLNDFTKLEVLDISGDTSFNNLQDRAPDSVAVPKLDMSGREVTEFTFLSQCKSVCQLSPRGCLQMDTLSSEGMLNLQKLNLSNSTVIELPTSISKLYNLRELLLENCPRLTSLPQLSELTMLEVLNLSGDTSFSQFQDESFGNNHALCKLDISETRVTEFSFLSGCSTLSELSLRGCTNLESINFEDVLNLQKLDVSQSNIKILSPSIIKLCKLNQLLVKGCSSLTALPPLKELPELKVIDISCTSMEILDGISKRTNLRFLGVSKRKFFWDIDSENDKEVIEHLNWDLYESENFGEARIHITVSKADIFHSIVKNRELWEKCFKRFHFCLCFSTEWAKEKDIYLEGNGFVFKYIYYQTNHIPQLTEEPDNFFKICGFETLPHGIQQVLNHVEVLYLKKNDFLKRLLHVGAHNVKVMRECWIERCNLMENTFHEEDVEENLALGRCLENLWVSYLPQLKCLFQGVMPSGSFTCLKHIYVDCCPRLVTLFSSHMELRKLETLKIKFCDEVENVFGEMLLGEETLPRLRTLVLWKLPNLKCIGEGALPSLKNLRVRGCPKLEKLPLGVRSTSPYLKIKGEKGWWIRLGLEDKCTKLRLHFTQI